MRERDRNENKMHIIRKKKQGGDGTTSNLVGSKALDGYTSIAQQMRRDGISPTAAVKNCKAKARGGGVSSRWEVDGGGGGGKERGRPTKLAPCLPLLPYGGSCGRILYLRRSD